MLLNLWLPILLSAVALFFVSFLSWMILQLHKQDWVKMAREEEFLKNGRDIGLTPGNYMFPGCQSQQEMQSEEFQKKWLLGPRGILSVFGQVSMGRNLGLTFLYFLAVSFCLAYVATLALPPGAGFLPVFRLVATVGLMTFLAAIVPHAIWFHCRIVGHVIESAAFALISGAIFAALWPAT